MKTNGIFLPFNNSFQGKRTSYECCEVKPRDVKALSCEDVLCLAGYITLSRKYVFHFATFYTNLDEFKKIKFEKLVYSFWFIPVPDQRQANRILRDIGLSAL